MNESLRSLRWLCLLALCALGWYRTWAQLSLADSGFQYGIYGSVAAEEPNGSPRTYLRAVITGNHAELNADGTLLVIGMVIDSFTVTGETNVIARADKCLLNEATKMVTSTNRLNVEAGQGQFQISGVGFMCNTTNSALFISNNVHTIIHPDLLNAAQRTPPRTPELALEALPLTAPTNAPITIDSERMTLLAMSNIVTYRGSVRVQSLQVDLTCQELTIHRATNGAIREIVAEGEVVVTSKQGGGTAFGARGVYSTEGGAELLTLTGAPARWQDGLRQGAAEQFVFDLENRLLQAEYGAWVQLPPQSLERTDWVLSESSPPDLESTNQLQRVEIRAELITVLLPTELRPGRSVQALTNVVVLNHSDGSQAGSDRAYYSELTGTVELDGHANWSSEGRLIRAQHLFLEPTNRFFKAAGEAYLKLPLAAWRRQEGLPEIESLSSGENTDTSGELEVHCRRYHYLDGRLTFEDDVQASLLDTNRVTAQLQAHELSVYGTNRLERIEAVGDVRFEQLPMTLEDGRIKERWLECQWMSLLVGTNGRPDRVLARTNVLAAESEILPDQPGSLLTELTAQEVTAEFMSNTNHFRQVLAERNVTLTRGPRTAFGQRALYLGATGELTLTGEPSMEAPEGRVTRASAIIFDLARNSVRVQQGSAKGEQVPDQDRLFTGER